MREIPFWDPPIDTALLVRAAAAGVDLSSVLSDINAALPNYRFTVILPKAFELCNEVRNFGAALLSALEKKDGEALARLRARHEVDLLQAIRTVKSNQLAESTALRSAAEKSKLTVEARRDYYRDIAFLNPAEVVGLALSSNALTQEIAAAVSDTLAAIAAWVPQFSGGTSGFYSSPVVVTAYGGEQVSRAASASGSAARSIGAVLSGGAALSQTIGSYYRRQDEWNLQETLANKELDQIQNQIDAATIREAIAQAELDNHDSQTDQAKAVDEFLRGKYTNQELYGWLQGQLSGLYFQTYKLAFDMAKKAERAFRHELGLQDSNYVQFGYWDNLKSGLLAGERLQTDLRRMEAAYLDQNRRELEITKHVSLAALSPAALIALKAVGTCEVDIPEWLYDLDCPGHYMRRIKSVALSIPCVTGRYTNVNCTLTQSYSKVRTETAADDYADASHFQKLRRHPVNRHEHGQAGQRALRAQLPRRPLPAVRGHRSDQPLADPAASRGQPLRRRDRERRHLPYPLHRARRRRGTARDGQKQDEGSAQHRRARVRRPGRLHLRVVSVQKPGDRPGSKAHASAH